MLQRFEITGVHFAIDDQLRKYVVKKLGTIDRYLPTNCRTSTHMEVRLRETRIPGQKAECEITLYMPHERIISLTESDVNMYAVVDVVKTKLRQQVQKYKDESMSGKQRRHIFGRLQRKLTSRMVSPES